MFKFLILSTVSHNAVMIATIDQVKLKPLISFRATGDLNASSNSMPRNEPR